jgi:VanZ family protein
MKVNNNSKFVGTKIVSITKYLFQISNIFLIVFYLYPGSIFGCFIYNDCKTQPQLTSDFIVSSNHVYAFVIISLLGFIAYSKKPVFIRIITYLFFISIFLELLHSVVPARSFEIKDLTGNIVGVAISLIIFLIFKLKEKNEQF